jgi:hypothetical protein
LVERGEQGPGFKLAVVVLVADQAKHALAAAGGGLEPDYGLDHLAAGPGDTARRRAVFIGLEAARLGVGPMGLQGVGDGVRAAQCLHMPGDRQQVAPIAVAVKQRRGRVEIGRTQRLLEIGKPAIGRAL